MKKTEKLKTVEAYMTKDVVVLAEDCSLSQAIETLLEHHVSNAPVVTINDKGEKELIGFVTEKDLLAKAIGSSFYADIVDVPIKEIMQTNIRSVTPEMDLFSAESLFSHHGLRHIPVAQDGHLVGMLSRSDLLRAASELFQERNKPKKRKVDASRIESLTDRYLIINRSVKL